MKLVEILARELKEWPEADFEQGSIKSMSQADDLQVSHYSGVRQVWREDVNDWSGHDYVPCSRFTLPELATDHATAIVTREMWQTERERIAKPGKKANSDGWVRHRGGKCPVEAGTLVEVRDRAGDIALTGAGSCNSVSWHWSHDKHPGDIMAYRICEPEQASGPAISEVRPVESLSLECQTAGRISRINPLAWRDRIREIDRTVEALEEERVSLVQRLEGEGLQLLKAKACGSTGERQVDGDMGDWWNWKVGDLILVNGDEYAADGVFMISNFDFDTDTTMPVYLDRCGWPAIECMKFHSRPSK